MRFFKTCAITILLLSCVVLGSACAGAKGDTGHKGDTGADGVGVQNIVNNGNGTLTVNLTNGTSYTTDNFTGPKGEKGDTGAQDVQGIQGLQGTPGIGVEWVGEWDSATLYGKYDGVGYQGSSYISRQPNNTNNLPTDTNWWDLWVEKGDTGATGAAGADGADGAPGADGQDGAPGPNMIVAMGFIGITGNISQQYNIASCVWSAEYGGYIIGLTGMDYSSKDYVTLVTASTFSCHVGTAGQLGANMLVHIVDTSGNYVQAAFSFMVLECP